VASPPPAVRSAAPVTAPPPARDAQGRLLCPDSSISLQTTTGAPSYSTGAQPILGLSVTNSGSVRCVRDLSGPLQIFTVSTAAGQRVWSTADCFPGEGADVRVLDPGETLQYNIRWSGTTSTPGCRPPRTQVGAGSYLVRATLGTLPAGPAPLTIT